MRLFITAIMLTASLVAQGLADGNPLLPPKEKMTRVQAMLADSVHLQKIDSDSGLEKITGLPTGPGNAAVHYAKLEQLFQEDRENEKSFKLKLRSKGIAEIFKAVMIRECRLSPEFYPALTSGEVKQPDMIIYLAYAQGLLDLAKELENKQDFRGAEMVYRSGLIFGWHLTQAPESLLVLSLGIRIKGMITREYAQFLQRQLSFQRHELAQAYFTNLQHAQTTLERKLRYFLGNTLVFNSLYSAIRIATEDQDPAWRREAIIRLGVYRHGAPGSDGKIIFTDPERQKHADAALTWIAERDPIPTNRELAVWVINKLTPEKFVHMMQIGAGASKNAK